MRNDLLQYLASLQQSQRAFMAFRTAQRNEIIVFAQDDATAYYNAIDDTYAVFAPFDKSQPAVFIPAQEKRAFLWQEKPFVTSKIDLKSDDAARASHVAMVKKAIVLLQDDGLVKVVLSRKHTQQTTYTPTQLFERLLDAYPSANTYFFYHPKVSTWMGATPETLAFIEGNRLQTMSLAGTAIYDASINHQWGDKELQEQQIVTDYVVQSLLKAGALNIAVSDVETVRAGSLIHLKTNISAQVPDAIKDTILAHLHPTPAVCGVPVMDAQRFILENENYNRSFYTGYLGMVSREKSQYYVNLRCMELTRKNEVAIYVGGGITKNSNPDAEFEETSRKLKTMLDVL